MYIFLRNESKYDRLENRYNVAFRMTRPKIDSLVALYWCIASLILGKKFVEYELIYEMNRYYLGELGLKYVSDGSRSITNHSNIQPFLIHKFKFRKAYCNISLYYKWYMRMAVKLLYPFRKMIKHPKVAAVLNMEAMVKGEL